MGFVIVQAAGERLITPAGTLMSHQASGGFQGQFGGNGKGQLFSRLNWITKILKKTDESIAARMGMKVEDYQNLITNEYWVNGSDAVNDKAADREVLPRCGKSLMSGQESFSIQTMFGAVTLAFSKCPLITYPLSVKIEGKANASASEIKELQKFVDAYKNNKKQFVQDYIITDSPMLVY
jgi:ClpP protease-like protein